MIEIFGVCIAVSNVKVFLPGFMIDVGDQFFHDGEPCVKINVPLIWGNIVQGSSDTELGDRFWALNLVDYGLCYFPEVDYYEMDIENNV